MFKPNVLPLPLMTLDWLFALKWPFAGGPMLASLDIGTAALSSL